MRGLVYFLACCFASSSIYGDESIARSQLLNSWKKIEGKPLTLEFSREIREFFHFSDDSWQGTLVDEPVVTRTEGKFLRDQNRFVWIQDGYKHYESGGQFIAIFPEKHDGFASATVSEAAMANHLDVIELLCWFEPLAAPEYQKVLKLPENDWILSHDSDIGRCVGVELRDRKKLTKICFAEAFDWRVSNIEDYRNGALVSKTTYSLDDRSGIELPKITRWTFDQEGHPTRIVETRVTSIARTFEEEWFDDTIPPMTDVYDETTLKNDERHYLVREDGSKRYYTREELLVAGSLSALLEEPEAVFGEEQPSWITSNWMWVIAGIGLCLVSLVFAFRRQWTR